MQWMKYYWDHDKTAFVDNSDHYMLRLPQLRAAAHKFASTKFIITIKVYSLITMCQDLLAICAPVSWNGWCVKTRRAQLGSMCTANIVEYFTNCRAAASAICSLYLPLLHQSIL
jgi:hypothetical protein